MNQGNNPTTRTNNNSNIAVPHGAIGDGITTLNLQTAPIQTITGGGNGLAVTSLSNNHNITISTASLVSPGVLSTTAQSIAGVKTISDGIITPSLSSETNTDLILNAGGTGAIKINTIQSRGIQFGTDTGTNITDQVVFAPGGDITQKCLIMGVINRGGLLDYLPFIGAQIPSVSWQTLRLNHSGGSVIFSGDITQTDSTYNPGNTYKNVLVGTCNIFGGSLAITSTPFVDSSRNITNCPTINGITVPASGGTFAKLSDIPSPGGNQITGEISNTGTILFQSSSISGASFSCAKGALGLYTLTLNGATGWFAPCGNADGTGGNSAIINFERTAGPGQQFLVSVRNSGGAGAYKDNAFSFQCYVN